MMKKRGRRKQKLGETHSLMYVEDNEPRKGRIVLRGDLYATA